MWPVLAFCCLLDSASGFIPVAPRESLRVTTQGSGNPVVLIPGLLGSAFAWRKVLPRLAAAGYRGIVIEPLGIGGSARPASADYSLSAQADRIAAALDSLGVRRGVVVAHAVGSSIALRLALRQPDLVAGIVTLEGGVAEAATTPGFRRAMELAPWIRLLGGERIIRSRLRRHLLEASGDRAWVTDATIAGYTADYAADVGATLRAFLATAYAREPGPLAPRLGTVRCPVRLLVGGAPHPSSVPAAEVEILRRGLADFAIDSVAGVGHFPHEERPDAVVDAVRRLRLAVAAAGGAR